jgi:hypothetical protein
MKITLTYAKLTDAVTEFERLRTMPATMQLLIGDRLGKFYQKNQVLFTSMGDRIEALMIDCVEKDDEGNYEKIDMIDSEGKQSKGWKFYDDAARDRFNDGLKVILEQSVTIEI